MMRLLFRISLITTLLFLILTTARAQIKPLETHYETSGFTETPGYDESVEYCKKLAASSSMLEYREMGISPLGNPIPLLILSKNFAFRPVDASRMGNTIVLIQACVHPGEPAGKDAGFMLIRDLVLGITDNRIIDNLTVLFIPIYNADGHQRFGKYNRINQNGPKEMGWRTNSLNLNLNRDYLKADAPETHIWLELFNNWNPHFFVDLHSTNGGDYQYSVTYRMETGGNMDQNLTEWQLESFIPAMETSMEEMGEPIFHYVSYRRWHDPKSGIAVRVSQPRLAPGYTAIRNRPGLLVETHMMKDYKTRVEGSYLILKFTLEYLSKNGEVLKNIIAKGDYDIAHGSLRKDEFPLDFELTPDSIMLNFKGFEYTVEKSELTGGMWVKYSNIPVEYPMAVFQNNRATKMSKLPFAYILPPQYTEISKRLDYHGIKYRIAEETTETPLNYYYISNPVWTSRPFEGRIRLNSFELTDTILSRKIPEKSLIIPVDQPAGRVVAHILEPNSPDSYLSWGFFNEIFEQKEYAEMYVMEKMAREMIENNSELLKEFEEFKKQNPELSNNQWALLNWFYSKTPWWDVNINVYPIGRIYDSEILKNL